MLKKSLTMQNTHAASSNSRRTRKKKNKKWKRKTTFKILFKFLEGLLVVLKFIGVISEFFKK